MIKWLYNFIPVGLFDLIYERKHGYRTTSAFIQNVDPDLLEKLSEKKAIKIFKKARRTIPAYKKVLKENKIKNVFSIKDFNNRLPILTKENYVKKYPLQERTSSKKFPKQGMIVESSGSSTKYPTNWFRTFEEEINIAKDVEFESRYIFGDKEYIVISCWTLGAWTTSYSFCFYFEPLGIVKNIGPDVEQVIRTIKTMGPTHNYLIGGYPPFIKHLIDKGGINWKKYKIDLVVGGEGFIPGWRKYIKSKLRDKAIIISAYGASDLETGLAVETSLCQHMRDIFAANPNKVKKLFNVDEAPMFFQYNPLRFYINNIPETQEFHTTVLTKGHVGVKIKYNIKDRGGKISYNEMIHLLEKEFKGFSKIYQSKFKDKSLKLPFLWIAGRSDDVISIDGVNMYPQQVEAAMLENKTIYNKVQSFQISKVFHHDGDNHFLLYIQLQESIKPNRKLAEEMKKAVKRNLAKISKAYRLGLHDDPKSFEPHILLHKYKTGPFDTDKIKNKYIKKNS